MAKFLLTSMRPNGLGLRTRRANGKFTYETVREPNAWLKRDGRLKVAREHYSSAPAPATTGR